MLSRSTSTEVLRERRPLHWAGARSSVILAEAMQYRRQASNKNGDRMTEQKSSCHAHIHRDGLSTHMCTHHAVKSPRLMGATRFEPRSSLLTLLPALPPLKFLLPLRCLNYLPSLPSPPSHLARSAMQGAHGVWNIDPSTGDMRFL